MGTGAGGDCPDQGLSLFCAGAGPHFLNRVVKKACVGDARREQGAKSGLLPLRGVIGPVCWGRPSRMLKKSASFGLAAHGGSTYRKVYAFSSSLAAAALDGLFDHPAGCSDAVPDLLECRVVKVPKWFFNNLLGAGAPGKAGCWGFSTSLLGFRLGPGQFRYTLYPAIILSNPAIHESWFRDASSGS